MQIEWLSWCRNRSGCDGRRPSGQGWTRTKLRHAVEKGGSVSLCGRAVQCFERAGENLDGVFRPECPVCKKKLAKLEAAEKQAAAIKATHIKVKLPDRGEGFCKRADYVRQKTKQMREFGYPNLTEEETNEQIDALLQGKEFGAGLTVIGKFMEGEVIGYGE